MKPLRFTTVLLLLWASIDGACSAQAFAETPSRPTVRRSDVVFMYDNPSLYEAYGCTVLGWAGSERAESVQLAHSKGVRLYAQSIGFRTEFNRMIDFSPDFLDAACRNFGGHPFVVPWLWDHKYKGQSAWWWCTNSPLYRKYLESRLQEVVRAKADGLHIDDYTGTAGAVTWRSACFCRYCMAGFRDYLAKNLPKNKLTELGIEDLAIFDYQKFLMAKGVKAEDYNDRRTNLPLAAEFYDFQVKANNDFVVRFHKRAEELRGVPMSLAVNSGSDDPSALVIAPHLTYFCREVDHKASDRAVPLAPVYAYKLADGLGRPITSTAQGWDWAYVNEHKLSGLVRTWIGLSYAFGHHFMAPHWQWCFTQEKGTHWYKGPTEDYAWLYQFVRRNARLLDNYEAVASVAVVYDNAARRKDEGNIQPVCTTLAERNVPFTIVVAGDDWLDYRLDAAKLERFKAVVVAEPLHMDQPQRGLLAQIERTGRLIRWPDDRRLGELVPTPIQVEGSPDVLVVIRGLPGNENAPLAVHLVNRRYDSQKDAIMLQRDLTLRLRRDLLGGRKFTKAILHAPQTDSTSLNTSVDDQCLAIRVPQLSLWAIVELAE
jgi:hypothetical protein